MFTPCVHDSAHAHGKCLFGHSVDVTSKEPGDCKNKAECQHYCQQVTHLALAMMVSWARVLTRVLDTRELPGSLKAM